MQGNDKLVFYSQLSLIGISDIGQLPQTSHGRSVPLKVPTHDAEIQGSGSVAAYRCVEKHYLKTVALCSGVLLEPLDQKEKHEERACGCLQVLSLMMPSSGRCRNFSL